MTDGILNGRRVLIPRFVMAMDRFDRRDWLHARGILELIEGGTTYSGAETLASMTIAGGVTGPTNGEASMLTRECLEPVAPSYFKLAGSRLSVRAYGTILGTTAITTQQVSLFVGPTYASPIAGQMIGKLPAAQTPGTTAVVCDWWLDALVTVRVTGAAGSLICTGNFVSNMVTNTTWANTVFKSTAAGTASAPVVITSPGLLQALYFDLTSNQAAATAGNSATCLDYTLLSLN